MLKIMARLAPLLIADDIRQSLVLQQQLIKLGFKAHIVEPENNPEYVGQDIRELKRSKDFHEIVNAAKSFLVVSAKLRPNGKMHATLGVYRHYVFDKDNWPSLLLQFSSPRSINLKTLMDLVEKLTPLAGDRKALQNELRELNKTLRWLKFRRVSRKAKLAANLDSSPSAHIAETIMQQLGGNKFYAMVNPRHVLRLKAGVQFDVSGRLTKEHINRIGIVLQDDDTYAITTYRLRNLDLKKIETKLRVHVEELQKTFTQMTGLDTHL